MIFFDPKEEVLDIQITQHGKRLLSKGKFKPSYYAFFDNDILYDSEFAGFSESQQTIEGRIQEETPRIKSQYNFANLDEPRAVKELQHNVERHFTFVNPIGTSDLISTKAPKWDLLALQGEMTSAVSYMTSSFQTIKIPQIEIDIEYETAVSVQGHPTVFKEDKELSSKIFSDSSYISVKPEQLVMRVLEENTEFEKENFSIEVFLLDTETNSRIKDSSNVDLMTPLYFVDRPQEIQNGILVDLPIWTKRKKLTPRHVEYYFNVHTDSDIDAAILCESIAALKSQEIYVDLDINCPDVDFDYVVSDPYQQEIDDVCETD